ncbi:hypothetical protein [Burkholderia territorii]|uniref:hypothetical protein n=1 Tax=Burkholderia territorii TaxID=1503055 RepID=UPI0012D90CF7|nr:hypothetical protein [Burkholderia territorii]
MDAAHKSEIFCAQLHLDPSLVALSKKLSDCFFGDFDLPRMSADRLAKECLERCHNRLANFLQSNRSSIYEKLCSVMDFSLARSIHNAAADSPIFGGMHSRHTTNHEILPSERKAILNSVMTEYLDRVVEQESKGLIEYLTANKEKHLRDPESTVRHHVARWINDVLLVNESALSGPGQGIAMDKATLAMALKLCDAFMMPRAEVIDKHAEVFHRALQKYSADVARILNDTKDSAGDLNVKSKLKTAREAAWETIVQHCGSYLGLDADQARMMKHMASLYSDLNYGIGRWATTVSSTLGLASVATQLINKAFIAAHGINPLSGHLVKAFVSFATNGILRTGIGAGVQMLAGDVATNAKMLRRYNDTSTQPPQYSSLLKSVAFKENRELIRSCAQIMEAIRNGDDDLSRELDNLAHNTAVYATSMLDRFQAPSSVSHFFNENAHLFSVLEEAREVLENEGGAGELGSLLAQRLVRDGLAEPSREDIFIRLAMLDADLRVATGRLTDEGNVLIAFSRELIDNISSPSERNRLLARVEARSGEEEEHIIDPQVLQDRGRIAQALISANFGALKMQKLSDFLKNSAADASMRAVVTGAAINSVIPAVSGMIAAVPGLVAGSILAPGAGTAAVGGGSALVVNHLSGKAASMVAGSVVTRLDAKAAVEGRMTGSIRPGKGLASLEDIRKQIEKSRMPELQKLHDQQIDAVVVARVDDLADTIAKNRHQVGRLLIMSLFNTAIPDAETRRKTLSDFLQFEKNVADIETCERVIENGAAQERVTGRAREDMRKLQKLQRDFGVDTPAQTNDALTQTRSLRSGKQSKLEHADSKLGAAKQQLEKLVPASHELGDALLERLVDCLANQEGGRRYSFSDSDVTNLLSPFVYPVNVTRGDFYTTCKEHLHSIAGQGNLMQSIRIGDSEDVYKTKDVAKNVDDLNKKIYRAEQDIVAIAKDHFNYRSGNFDKIKDRFNIYDRANRNFDTAQMQARSYAEISGTGLARVGARLTVGLTTGLVTSITGGAVTGLSSAARTLLPPDATKEVIAAAGVAGRVVADPAADGLKAGLQIGANALARIGTPLQATYPAARRGDWLAGRAPVKPKGLEAETPQFTFRELGLAGLRIGEGHGLNQEERSFLQGLIKDKASHKIFSFERHGTQRYLTDRPVGGQVLGLSTRDPSQAQAYRELSEEAKAGEGRSATRRTVAEIGKSIKSTPNAAKFSLKALAPSDARAVVSLNNLEEALVHEVEQRSRNVSIQRESFI